MIGIKINKLKNLTKNNKKNALNNDIIVMKSDVILTDKKGEILEIKVPPPEYIPDILS